MSIYKKYDKENYKYLNYKVLLLFLFLYDFSFSQNLAKDTFAIKEVQITAKRSVKEKAVISSTIDSNIIQANINENLSEILAQNSPVFIKSQGRGALSTISFRGTAASHTNVLWNGVSLQSPMLGEIDFSLIPVFFIDDISLEYGGSSLQHSSGSLGGNILLDNKVNWKNKQAFKLQQSIGSFSTYQTLAQCNLGKTHLQSKTRLLYNYSKNDFSFRNKNIADIDSKTGAYIYPIQKNTPAQYLQYGLMQELYYRWAEHYQLSMLYWGQKNNRYLPRINTYEGNDFSNIAHQDESTHRIISRIKRFGEHSNWQIQSAFFTRSMEYYLKNYISGRGYLNAIFSESQTYSSYNQAAFSYHFSENSLLSVKYDINHHQVNTIDTVKKEGYKKTRLEQFLYLDWRQRINKKLSSTLILRQNIIDKNYIPFIPYLGLDYVLWKKHKLYLKTSISKNYHTPSLNDLYWQPGGNLSLQAENSWTGDFSLQAHSKIKKTDLFWQTTFFYSNINNWIIWIPSPLGYWSPENIQNVISKGIENHLKLKFKISKVQFFFNVNYAYTLSLNMTQDNKWGKEAYQKQLPYVPKHSFNIFAQIQWKKWQINYQHNSYSERFTTSTNDFTRRDWLYPYFMNQIAIGKVFLIKKKSLNLQLKIYNLFNEEYRSVLGRPMPGINYLLSLKINL